MSRTRTIIGTNGAQDVDVFYGSLQDTRSPHQNPSNNIIYPNWTQTAYSSITDVNESSILHKHFNPCSHFKRRPASISKRIAPFSYTKGGNTMLDGELRINYVGGVSPKAVSHPGSLVWSDIVTALADDVLSVLRTKSLLAVTLLEFEKTYQMVRNPFGLLKQLRRKSVWDWNYPLARLAKDASGKFLEYRYGWKPFFSDLQNFVNSVGRVWVRSQDDYTGARALTHFRKGKELVGSALPPSISDATFLSTANNIRVLSSSNRAVVQEVYKPVRSHLSVTATRWHPVVKQYHIASNLAEGLGIDPGSWLRTLWEVVPYSFVVDWFINTEMIMGYPQRLLLEHENLSRLGYSIKSMMEYSFRYAPTPSNTQWPCQEWLGEHVFESSVGTISQYDRYTGLPTAESVLTGKGLSILHTFDSLGLLIQLVKPPRR